MLCAYNPKNQTAFMFSIPRDTFVGKNQSSASGNDKINALYTSSPNKIMKAVSDITGVDIEHYIIINNNALINMVDAIGGVEFDVPIDMKYDDITQDLHINLKAGIQKINGEKAEQLLRFRHNNDGSSYPYEYGDNDYGRMRTQREFISATISQTLNIKNITKIKSIVNAIFDNVETNLSMNQILDYVPYVVNFNTEELESEQLPGASDKYNGLWFFVYDKKETNKIVESMVNKIEGISQEENISANNTVSDDINTSKK